MRMTIRNLSALALALAAYTLAAPAAAQRDTTASPSVEVGGGAPVTLAGRVLDARTGEPLRAASVKLPAARVSVYTDEQGRFSVRVPAGTYDDRRRGGEAVTYSFVPVR